MKSFSLSKLRYLALPRLIATLGYLFLVSPIAIIVVASFGSGQELQFPPKQFSLDLYKQFFGDHAWWLPALRSVGIAICTALLALAVTIPASYAISRTSIKQVKWIQLLFISPMLVPVISLGLGMYMFLSKVHLDNTLVGIVLSHCALVIPFVYISISAGLKHTDPTLESVAMLMGAGKVRIFFAVVLPQLKPSILVSALFALLISFDEVVVAYFISGPETTTLPVKMYSALRWEVSPVLTAISTLLTVVSLAACLGIMALENRTEKSS